MNKIINHLQSEKVKNSIYMRNKIKSIIRDILISNEFVEIDTPILGPQIPEYTNSQFKVYGENGEVYYLPQSPQIYKQILMNAGYEKYFQFGRCFRYGEIDFNHTNEFLQIDVEMNVSDKSILMKYVELIIKSICDEYNIPCSIPFPIIAGSECIQKFGTDKPDLREKKGDTSFLWIVDLPMLERLDDFERIKVISADVIIDGVNYILSHHAFAMPLNWNKVSVKNDLLNIYTDSFDLVANGIEICSGDIRINKQDLQKDIFNKLDISLNYYKKYLDLLNPNVTNGGFALGMERLIMALTQNSLKETNAFYENWYSED